MWYNIEWGERMFKVELKNNQLIIVDRQSLNLTFFLVGVELW